MGTENSPKPIPVEIKTETRAIFFKNRNEDMKNGSNPTDFSSFRLENALDKPKDDFRENQSESHTNSGLFYALPALFDLKHWILKYRIQNWKCLWRRRTRRLSNWKEKRKRNSVLHKWSKEWNNRSTTKMIERHPKTTQTYSFRMVSGDFSLLINCTAMAVNEHWFRRETSVQRRFSSSGFCCMILFLCCVFVDQSKGILEVEYHQFCHTTQMNWFWWARYNT